VGSLCVVLFFDEHNPQDAVILAVYATIPTPPPGRLTFVTSYEQLNGVSIASGGVQTVSLTGGSSNLPAGILGVLYKVFFTSATVGAFLQLAPHGTSDIGAYATIGNIVVANSYVNSTGVLAVDANGSIDLKAINGSCTVTLYTYGYVF
jgi:hypothetical protein